MTPQRFVFILLFLLQVSQTFSENLRTFSSLSNDSTATELKKQILDSLRTSTQGAPVIVEGDTLFYLYAPIGYLPLSQRVTDIVSIIHYLNKNITFEKDSMRIQNMAHSTAITYEKKVIMTISDHDAMWSGLPRDSLAKNIRDIIVRHIEHAKTDSGIWQITSRIGFLLLVIVCQFFLLRLTKWGFGKLKLRVIAMKGKRIRSVTFRNYELLDADRLTGLAVSMVGLFHFIVTMAELFVSTAIIFIIFPQTEHLAYKLLSYVWNPVRSILKGLVSYIPNFLTIVVICISIHYLIRLLHYFSREIDSGHLKINGFYSDWALPTYHIVRFLLYAFMIAMIYPYLPGSDSGVFQGISVFVGLIISLGSSTVIGNIVAGLVITYMRPFKQGDFIKLNDITGNIIERTPLVTRIRTPKNEIVTIPNSFVMSSHSVNYSISAQEYGLIVHTEVTIGYDAPWRLVHELLIDSALKTEGIQNTPRPFVLETSLSDYYPVYQINAYTLDANHIARIYSNLHQNIQDCFNKAGVEIMSPQFTALRNGNKTTIPEDDLSEKNKTL